MQQLGTLEELPLEYREMLTSHNLVPLWPQMRSVLPYNIPSRDTTFLNWRYENIRPLLMRAGELTPMEKAERRVLILANPGHGLENIQATPSIYLGMQLILPGETAPNHRHTPNAVRIIVEGEGAYTTVNDEPCKMERGDLILTPAGMWHEHHHGGEGPIVWLDILDLPLMYRLNSSWSIEGENQNPSRSRDKSYADYSASGIVPTLNLARGSDNSPQLRYPWSKTKACLEEMAADHDKGLLAIAYVNPENGQSIFPSIGFGAIMLRPGEKQKLPKMTSAKVFHVIEGAGSIMIEGHPTEIDSPLNFVERDTLSAPGYTSITITNMGEHKPLFLLTADEQPLHHYLGIF